MFGPKSKEKRKTSSDTFLEYPTYSFYQLFYVENNFNQSGGCFF